MKNPVYYSIGEFKQGKKEAFEGIYHTHYAALYYFVKRIVTDRAEAEDIVAETFVKLWGLRTKFETPQNIKAFLFITARNACMDYLRCLQRQSTNQKAFQYILLQDTDFTFAHDEIKIEVLSQVYAEIENLPPKCKLVFKMAYLQGLKNEEIARQLNLSYQTIKNQKLKAVKMLRIALVNIDLVLLAMVFLGCSYISV
jgi:RNA polymerase sigma-70 factor (family 1)